MTIQEVKDTISPFLGLQAYVSLNLVVDTEYEKAINEGLDEEEAALKASIKLKEIMFDWSNYLIDK